MKAQRPENYENYGFCRSQRIRYCDFYLAKDCPKTCKYAIKMAEDSIRKAQELADKIRKEVKDINEGLEGLE